MLNPSWNLDEFISRLTGREESMLTEDLRNSHDALSDRISGQRVMVVGGAGTIGSSFVKAILKYRPGSLIVVDTNENGLTELVRDLRSTPNVVIPNEFLLYPMSLGDKVFEKFFKQATHQDIVANFAAHKHVRSEKDRFSIEAMIENNVIRAKNFLDLLDCSRPERFFCVSTDKATNPVNIMGASKSLMEKVIMAYSKSFSVNTARFANVAFSNGSLLDGFLTRISKGQPISAPTDVKRYFVSPIESGQICMLSCMLGNSSEIFFPKLEYSRDLLTFSEIAERFLFEMGLKPEFCKSEEEARQKSKLRKPNSPTYPVYFFESDTSGEKPVEEFYTDSEDVDLNRFASLGVVRRQSNETVDDANNIVQDLLDLFAREQVEKHEIVQCLCKYLPDFDHDERGKNLDHKM